VIEIGAWLRKQDADDLVLDEDSRSAQRRRADPSAAAPAPPAAFDYFSLQKLGEGGTKTSSRP